MPGIMPLSAMYWANGTPSRVFWRMVSSYRIAPLMYSLSFGVVRSSSRYARRFSSVFSMPTPAKRLAIVPEDSSMAMMPLPGATMATAVSASCSMLILWTPGLSAGPRSIALRPARGLGPGRVRAGAVPRPRAGHRARGRPAPRASERAQSLGRAVLADLQQAEGVGGAVGLHGLAAGEHHAVAGAEQAGGHQQADGVAGGLARPLAAAVVGHGEHVAHQAHAPARARVPREGVDRRARAEAREEARGAARFGHGHDRGHADVLAQEHGRHRDGLVGALEVALGALEVGVVLELAFRAHADPAHRLDRAHRPGTGGG